MPSNKFFERAATPTDVFVLRYKQPHIDALESIFHSEDVTLTGMTRKKLQGDGLVIHDGQGPISDCRHWKLTQAGKLLLGLMTIAKKTKKQ